MDEGAWLILNPKESVDGVCDAFLEDFAGYMFMIEGLCQEFYGSVCQPFSRHRTLNTEFNEVFHSGDSDLGSRRWTYDDGVSDYVHVLQH
jgi:hypothetical protein